MTQKSVYVTQANTNKTQSTHSYRFSRKQTSIYMTQKSIYVTQASTNKTQPMPSAIDFSQNKRVPI